MFPHYMIKIGNIFKTLWLILNFPRSISVLSNILLVHFEDRNIIKNSNFIILHFKPLNKSKLKKHFFYVYYNNTTFTLKSLKFIHSELNA